MNMEQSDSGVDLNVGVAITDKTSSEIESLKQALLEKEGQLLLIENACIRESERQVELEDSVIAWQDKYDRLYESHKRVQKINQSLEDKLLKMVDRNASERAQLTSDVATLSVRLAQANFNIAKLQREIERYKSDIHLAIQLLQCKPDRFMPQKISSLPTDVQSKVSAYMSLETNSHSGSEGSGVGVATSASYKVLPASESPPPAPCPFPPTAMVYSMRGLDAKNNGNFKSNKQATSNSSSTETLSNSIGNNHNNNNHSSINNSNANINNAYNRNHNNKNSNNINKNNSSNVLGNDPDLISPLIMAKYLENELKSDEIKHCDTCQCTKRDLTVLADVSRLYTVATQTPMHCAQITQHTNSSSHNNNNSINNNNHLNGINNLETSLGGQLCMRCHSNLNSPSRTNSPFLMKMVKSSDSVISETKSSVSDLNDVDKLFTPPPKKDDLMVNPILGHHRLCDRTSANSNATFIPKGLDGNGTYETSDVKTNTTASATTSAVTAATSTTIGYPPINLDASYDEDKYCSLLGEISMPRSGNGTANVSVNVNDSGLCLLNGNSIEEMKKSWLNESDNCVVVAHQTSITFDEDSMKAPMCDALRLLQNEANATTSSKRNILSVDVLQDAIIKSPTSTCSTNKDVQKNLVKSLITSSMNSLWSKGSNCESSKMFENFNRNLIRTIKSENPRYRGPRLCAMRIQRTENGQSNILLDNMESLETVTPVIYRRRERLLDEELDDTKDIITSNSPAIRSVSMDGANVNLNPDINPNPIPNSSRDEAISNKSFADSCPTTQVYRHIYIDEQPPENDWSISNNVGTQIETECQQESVQNVPHSQAYQFEQISRDCEVDCKVIDVTNDSADMVTTTLTTDSSIIFKSNGTKASSTQSKPTSKLTSSSYEILRNDSSSKNSINSKSCTQSSSLCSEAVNLHESIMMRRQQLSRVAEWIQKNTQQFEQQQQQHKRSSTEKPNAGTMAQCDSFGTDRQSSFSTLDDRLDSVSIEKLSMDSGYKTTPQPQTIGLVVALANGKEQSSKTDSASTNNSPSNIAVCDATSGGGTDVKKNSIHYVHSKMTSQYKYHWNMRTGALPITNLSSSFVTHNSNCNSNGNGNGSGNGNGNGNLTTNLTINQSDLNGNNTCEDSTILPLLPEQPTCDILNYKYYPCERDKSRAIDAKLHMTSTNVDIAQMEYNVKQFLLKQNEWSMRNNRYIGGFGGTGGGSGVGVGGSSKAAATAATVASVITSTTATFQRPQAIRRSKLFSSVGIGPGVGERVRTEFPKSANSINQTSNPHAMPQRTETNL